MIVLGSALRVFGHALGNSVYDKEHLKRVKNKVKVAHSMARKIIL